VFSTRAPHRPNSLGLSVVPLLGIKGRVLAIGHHDMLDGTPVLDIKPYIPESDIMPHANAGWIDKL
jgi:tRNA (Thr-GGU) A37 N-methylase